MSFNPPNKSQTKVVGDKVRHGDILSSQDIKVINDWRAAHSMLLTRWQSILRQRLKTLGMKNSVLLAQRLKRYPTIINKLQRYDMNLATMHDIAGCRLIFKDLNDLHKFRESIHNHSSFEHERVNGSKWE